MNAMTYEQWKTQGFPEANLIAKYEGLLSVVNRPTFVNLTSENTQFSLVLFPNPKFHVMKWRPALLDDFHKVVPEEAYGQTFIIVNPMPVSYNVIEAERFEKIQ